MYEMRLLLFLCFILNAEACWFYSKQTTLDKIKQHLGTRTFVDRSYIYDMKSKLPKLITWAIEAIGVDNTFEDCDANKDGKITLQEMVYTTTCLSSCTKLAILNTVVGL